LQYTVTSAGEQFLTVSFSLSNKVEGKILVEFNGNPTEMPIPESKNWKATFKQVPFKAGNNVIRIKVLSGEFNFQSIQFK